MKYLAIIVLFIWFFISPVQGQFNQTHTFEKIDLTFQLEADPQSEAGNFGNPKNFWKVKYEVYVVDFAKLEKLGKCGYVEGRSIKTCSNSTDKKLDKKIKKTAERVGKGKFVQRELAADRGRKIFRTITLEPKILKSFLEAKRQPDKNPVLIIYVSSKVLIQNSQAVKLKKSYETEGFNWWKVYNSNNTVEYRNINKLNYHLIIKKLGDGRLAINVGYVHIG